MNEKICLTEEEKYKIIYHAVVDAAIDYCEDGQPTMPLKGFRAAAYAVEFAEQAIMDKLDAATQREETENIFTSFLDGLADAIAANKKPEKDEPEPGEFIDAVNQLARAMAGKDIEMEDKEPEKTKTITVNGIDYKVTDCDGNIGVITLNGVDYLIFDCKNTIKI